jgi:hypothetical protein
MYSPQNQIHCVVQALTVCGAVLGGGRGWKGGEGNVEQELTSMVLQCCRSPTQLRDSAGVLEYRSQHCRQEALGEELQIQSVLEMLPACQAGTVRTR